jgi:hypothetical protein
MADLFGTQGVKIIWNDDLAYEETDTSLLCDRPGLQRRYNNERTSRFGNDEAIALRGLIDQARQVSLGIMNIDGLHFDPTKLSHISLV